MEQSRVLLLSAVMILLAQTEWATTGAPGCIMADEVSVESVYEERTRLRVSEGPGKVRAKFDSRMRIKLKICSSESRQFDPKHDVFVLHVVVLEPIRDNAQKLLWSAQQTPIQEILVTEGDVLDATNEIAVETVRAADGKDCLSMELSIDGAAREATSVAQLKGEVILLRCERREVVFKGVSVMKDKKLESKYLAEMQVRATVKPFKVEEKQLSEVKLNLVGKKTRLLSWELTQAGKAWGMATGLAKEEDSNSLFIDGEIPKDVDLTLQIAVPVRTEKIKFDLRNILLP